MKDRHPVAVNHGVLFVWQEEQWYRSGAYGGRAEKCVSKAYLI